MDSWHEQLYKSFGGQGEGEGSGVSLSFLIQLPSFCPVQSLNTSSVMSGRLRCFESILNYRIATGFSLLPSLNLPFCPFTLVCLDDAV